MSMPGIAAQPNVLFIYADDLGYGDLSGYGHPVIQTPNIDALADQGVSLSNYYAPSALCSPSRAGVLTGRAPYRTGIRSWIPENSGIYLRDEEVTLAEVLRAEGYATALIGKWHLNSNLASAEEPQPTDQGFEYFYGHNAFQIPTNKNPANVYRGRELLPEQDGYTAQLYVDDFTNGPVVPIPSGLPEVPVDKLVPRGPGEYYANITYMDAQLGRLLQWLERNHLVDDTVVVFTSDNGPVTSDWLAWYEINAHGSTGGYRGRKHYLYEGGIKVPAIVRYPAIAEAGSTSDAVIVGTDLFVTLALMGGGTIPSDRPIDGIDVREALSGGSLPKRTVFWALDSVSNLEFAVRHGDWKLFLDREGKPQALYELSSDPLEFFDRSNEEPAVVAELLSLFQQSGYLGRGK
jgi:arylsulfatase A-like enzyme